MENLYEKYRRGRVRAPKFPGNVSWLGCEAGNIDKLKNRIILLDFWTSGCINCIHVLDDLKYLEKKFGGKLQIIGIHCGKFNYEMNDSAVLHAALRHGLTHPVVNDSEKKIWDSYAVNSWPTFVLIDPEGYAFGMLTGEGNREMLDKIIEDTIIYFDGKTEWPAESMKFDSIRPCGSLSYPSKIAISKEGNIAVSEAGANRLLIFDTELKLQKIIGSGTYGFLDGSFESALFKAPQGLVFDGTLLYVADTENHAIRLCDMKSETVTTIAGNGEQEFNPIAHGDGLSTKLNSPWDLELIGDNLYVAMAGNHQIWIYNIPSGMIYSLIGTGAENIRDGYFEHAVLAQPSALCFDGASRLYFLDAETSSLRCALLGEERVVTIIGEGLFVFGNSTGSLEESQLQHPLGIACSGEVLHISDTYNNRVLSVNTKEGRVTTVADDFEEPTGLAVYDGYLYVADSNRGRIVRISLMNCNN